MSRLYGYLLAEQCRMVAGLGFVVWGALLCAALVSEWLVGLPLGSSLRLGHLAALATVVLPQVISMTLPLATGLVVLKLHEGGELQAMWLLGRGSHWVAAALLVPAIPAVLVFCVAVHAGRPAAFATLTDLRTEADLDLAATLGLLRSDGLGIVQSQDGLRLLADLGDRALAVELRGSVSRDAADLRLGDGEFSVLGIAPDAERWQGSFRVAELRVSGLERDLARSRVRELSTSFLSANLGMWSRMRPASDAPRARWRARRELAERSWSILCLGLSTVLVLWPLWWRRVSQASHVLAGLVLPALLIALVLPRWLP